MNVVFHGHPLELGGKHLHTDLRESNDILSDPARLRQRMDEDGYLLIRGLYTRDEVLQCRQQLLQRIAEVGGLDPAAPLMDGKLHPDPAQRKLPGELWKDPAVKTMVESPSIMGFFERFFGEPATTFTYKWLRAVGQGGSTGCHYDVVYMGRGSKRLFTTWTPVGKTTYDMGTLAILCGSHRFEKITQTYGRDDVDRDQTHGWFSNNPIEVMDEFGGQWRTTQFEPGDAIIFSMFTMHASLSNTSDKWRLSTDTRYQPASDPADERWAGDGFKGHYGWSAKGKVETIEEGRKRWGV